MKTFAALAASGIAGMTALWGAEAGISIHCLSVRMNPGTGSQFGLSYQLQITSDDPLAGEINGELFPRGNEASTSHGSNYRMSGDVLFEDVPGAMAVNVPENIDEDANGVPDFFEVNHAVNATTEGVFEDVQMNGNISAVWSREAGSSAGTCRLTLAEYGLEFTHAFEILAYRGRLDYEVAGTNVTASVRVVREAGPEQTLEGPLVFRQLSRDLLGLNPGALTNEAGEGVAYLPSEEVMRRGRAYFDIFVLGDGDASTVIEDYDFWWMRIEDANDSDQNGIPDFSDQKTATPLSLGLVRGADKLTFALRGEPGTRVTLEQSAAVFPGNWTPAQTVELNSSPQTVELPLPAGPTFWRLRSG